MHEPIDDADCLHVLYVEDNEVNAVLMQAVLSQHRPHLLLVIAPNGAQALNLAAQWQPALLLLDMRLPDCHGAALLIQLRGVAGWADIPAIAVTAEFDFQILGTSFCELWNKPLDIPHVLASLDRWVPRASRR